MDASEDPGASQNTRPGQTPRHSPSPSTVSTSSERSYSAGSFLRVFSDPPRSADPSSSGDDPTPAARIPPMNHTQAAANLARPVPARPARPARRNGFYGCVDSFAYWLINLPLYGIIVMWAIGFLFGWALVWIVFHAAKQHG